MHVLVCAYLCFKCQEIARELVLLREQMASCQASEARMETGLSSKAMEATIWQASSLAGVAYALVQHVARPLWVRHFETDFPLDRFVYPPGLLYLINIILFYINLLDVGVQALQLDGGDLGPPSLQLPGALPAEDFCLHCLHSAGPRGEFIQKALSFVLQNSEWAPILTYGGMCVARTYTRKHRPGVHVCALPPALLLPGSLH